MTDTRWQKWDSWMKTIHDDLRQLCTWKMVFCRLEQIVDQNPSLQANEAVCEFLKVAYASTVAMGVRRQVKIDPQSISLMRLFSEIKEDPEILSRERYKAHFDGSDMLPLADEMFDEFAGAGGAHVDPNLVERDMKHLAARAQAVEDFADRCVAHLDTRGPKFETTYFDLNGCVDYIENLYLRYYSLFRACTLYRVLPVFQYDWEAAFKEPWIRESQDNADA